MGSRLTAGSNGDHTSIGNDVRDFLNSNKRYGARIKDAYGIDISEGFIITFPECLYSWQTIKDIKAQGIIKIDNEMKIKVIIMKSPFAPETVDICSKTELIQKLEKTILSLESTAVLFEWIILIAISTIMCGLFKNWNIPRILSFVAGIPLTMFTIELVIKLYMDINHYQLRGIENNDVVNLYELYNPRIDFLNMLGICVSILCCTIFVVSMVIATKQRRNEIILNKVNKSN
uniref:Integral membrane protein n=1 Tax=Parastrongyloides trichosuri TaxID=131310 RepID=A0A0N5A705_PARTI